MRKMRRMFSLISPSFPEFSPLFSRFHPWNAEPDEADAEVGTVKWVYNEIKKNWQRWETGENEGGSLGAEVVNGTLFNSTKDQWTSVGLRVEGLGLRVKGLGSTASSSTAPKDPWTSVVVD